MIDVSKGYTNKETWIVATSLIDYWDSEYKRGLQKGSKHMLQFYPPYHRWTNGSALAEDLTPAVIKCGTPRCEGGVEDFISERVTNSHPQLLRCLSLVLSRVYWDEVLAGIELHYPRKKNRVPTGQVINVGSTDSECVWFSSAETEAVATGLAGRIFYRYQRRQQLADGNVDEQSLCYVSPKYAKILVEEELRMQSDEGPRNGGAVQGLVFACWNYVNWGEVAEWFETYFDRETARLLSGDIVIF
mgnify:CR=1 FL=1